MAEFKPLPFEGLLALDEKEIRALFPNGAVSNRNGKWRPATEDPEKTLEELLKAKKRRGHVPRLLHRDSTRGYTEDPKMSMRPDAGEAVDERTQTDLTRAAKQRDDAQLGDELLERQAKVIANKVAKIQREGAKLGLDFGPRLNALLREARQEIVQQRQEAA